MKRSREHRRPLLSTILVLCCFRCDEIATVAFASLLRQAGIRVKLIGLEGRSCVGRSGIVLKNDRTLDGALQANEQIAAIVVPIEAQLFQRYAEDRRLLDLWQRADFPLIVAPESTVEPLLALLSTGPVQNPPQSLSYGAQDDLAEVVAQLAEQVRLFIT